MGVPHTPARTAAISLALKGHRHSAATRAKLSAANVRRWRDPAQRAAHVAARRRSAHDPADVRTWTVAEKSQAREGRRCEWPGGCERSGVLGLDHDHNSGWPRGILCRFHNRNVLGLYERYRAEIEEYLARFA